MIVVTSIALVVFALAAVITVYRLWKGPTLADRMVALDALLFTAGGALSTYVVRTGETAFVPVIVVVALVAFIGTVVVARAIESESP